MKGTMWVAAAFVLGALIAQPADAQQQAVGLTVRGGGFNALTSLNEPGTDPLGSARGSLVRKSIKKRYQRARETAGVLDL